MLIITRIALALIVMIQLFHLAANGNFTKITNSAVDWFCVVLGIIGGISALYYFFA